MKNILINSIAFIFQICNISAQICGSYFIEDFQSYSLSSKFICQKQNDICWSTWTGNNSCTNNLEDATLNSSGGNKFMCISATNCYNNGPNDIIRNLGISKTGVEEFSFDIAIKNGKRGFITFLHDFSQNGNNNDESWAFDLLFENCIFYITLHDGSTLRNYSFVTYDHDNWYNVKVILDYDKDECVIVFNNFNSFKFKLSKYYSKSTLNAKYIRTVDFYGISCSHYYIDNVTYKPSTSTNFICSVSPNKFDVDDNSGTKILYINSNTSWTLQKSINATWLHLRTPSTDSTLIHGNGSYNLSIYFDVNNSAISRSATLSFICANGLVETIQFEQLGTFYCNITPNPVYVSFGAATVYLDALTNTNSTLSIPSADNWLQFSNGSKFITINGGGTVPLTIFENFVNVARVSTLSHTCNGVITKVDVIQEAKPINTNCIISPDNFSFPSQGGSSQVTITSNSNWVLNFSSTWVTIKEQGIVRNSPWSSIGDKTFVIEVLPNNISSPRSINLTFTCNGQKNINISQSGQTIAQSPCWSSPIATSERHIVIIPYDVQVDINGTGLNYGDWIGFFYSDGGVDYCAGSGEWKGNDLPITLFGNDNPLTGKNGFDDMEKFKIKICRNATGQTIDVTGIFFNSGIGRYTQDNCFTINGFSGIIRIEATNYCIQLPIRRGYNLISSYIEPINNDMLSLFSLRNSDVYVLDQDGNQTLPYLKINNIGLWDILQGYEVRSKDSFKIDKIFCGLPVDPSLLQYNIEPNKYQIISYPRSKSIPIDSVFSSYKTRISVIKDEDGNVYIPFLGINTLGQMKPFKGYYIFANAPIQFNFPKLKDDNNNYSIRFKEEQSIPVKFKMEPLRTGNNSTIIFPFDKISSTLKIGDEIGAFDNKDNLCGSAIFDGESMAMTVWGKDEFCEEFCIGYVEDDKYIFKIWKSNTLENIELVFETESDAKYRKNDILIVNSIATKKKSVKTIDFIILNQSLIINSIPCEFNYRILNILGQIQSASKSHNLINIESLNKGIYFVELFWNQNKHVISIYKQD